MMDAHLMWESRAGLRDSSLATSNQRPQHARVVADHAPQRMDSGKGLREVFVSTTRVSCQLHVLSLLSQRQNVTTGDSQQIKGAFP